jgi:hypothetical protein
MKPALAVAACLCPLLAAQRGPLVPPADWAERDLEAKWVAYRADLDANADVAERKPAWIRWLAAQGDVDLLEWIGIYEGWDHAGAELVARSARCWMRVAFWNLASADSHDLDGARKVLVQRPAAVLAWVQRYPVAVASDTERQLMRELSGIDRAERTSDQLPPLDEAEWLLAYLDVPAELAELGERLRAEPRVRYVHQVVRALRGVRVRGTLMAPHVAKVTALLDHPNTAVRTEAFAALASLPGRLVPHERLLALAGSDAPAGQRRLAVLTLSHAAHPSAFFALHEIAGEASHPANDVALARLREVGDAFTLAWHRRRHAEPSKVFMAEVESRLRRVAGSDRSAALLQVALERAAWAEAAGHPAAAAASDGLTETLTWLAPRAKQAVAKLRPEVSEWEVGGNSAEVRAAMVRHIERLAKATGSAR